jgi:superfamily II DNA or RNA helicase
MEGNYVWQEECLEKFEKKCIERGHRDFLIHACPGAGKTRAMRDIVIWLLDMNEVDKVVVFSPTREIKENWKNSFLEVGYPITPDYDRAIFDYGQLHTLDEYHGISLTYAANLNPKIVASICEKYRTAVILDEPHHLRAEENSAWGRAVVEAISARRFSISGTGTPYRTDRQRIPFFSYDEMGYVVADYSYTYSRGISDKVVRHILFPRKQGLIRYLDEDLEETEVLLSDDKELQEKRSNALFLALDAKDHDGYLANMIRDGLQSLEEIREVCPNAAMIIICKSIGHMKDIAELFKKIAGFDPVTVSYEDGAEGIKKIKAFRESTDKVILAVKMISEGVDIPRLQVGVFAGNEFTELALRQILGRPLRISDEARRLHRVNGYDAFKAVWHVPLVEPLISMMKKIEEEYHESFKEKVEREPRGGDGVGPRPEKDIVKLGDESWDDGLIFRGKEYVEKGSESFNPGKAKPANNIDPGVKKTQVRKAMKKKLHRIGYRLLPGYYDPQKHSAKQFKHLMRIYKPYGDLGDLKQLHYEQLLELQVMIHEVKDATWITVIKS